MSHQTDNKLKPKQVFEQPLSDAQESPPLAEKVQFSTHQSFVPATVEESDSESQIEAKLDKIIRPKLGNKWSVSSLLITFAGLVGWQAIDSVVTSIQTADWLALGWAGFVTAIASFGIGAIGNELWKLRKLRYHFSVQQQSEVLIQANSVGQGKSFCESLAKQAGIAKECSSYKRWLNSVTPSHSDAEVLDMYDAMVVAEQDKQATKVVSQHATESAALVAISPLAIADMLLVAWRNFKMIESLADIYGIELGYWSRLSLFKATLINIAAAGASELAIDASIDLMSMDLAGKISARAGQGLGVGILTARLGLKAMALLRPIPWHQERRVKLGAIRKKIVEKIAAITIK